LFVSHPETDALAQSHDAVNPLSALGLAREDVAVSILVYGCVASVPRQHRVPGVS
jgi:hypothetical protein